MRLIFSTKGLGYVPDSFYFTMAPRTLSHQTHISRMLLTVVLLDEVFPIISSTITPQLKLENISFEIENVNLKLEKAQLKFATNDTQEFGSLLSN